MVRATIVYGGALVVLGVLAYILSAAASVTALIPAFLGVVVLALGIAGRAFPGAALFVVVAAALVAVVAVFGSFRGVAAFLELIGGQQVERPIAAVAQALTVLLSVGYLVVIARRWMAGRRV
jgi:hypothetical protein